MSDSLCSPWNFPGQDTGVGNLSLLQGIFQTQGSNSGLLHCRQNLSQLSHKGNPHFANKKARMTRAVNPFPNVTHPKKWQNLSSNSLFSTVIQCLPRTQRYLAPVKKFKEYFIDEQVPQKLCFT